MRDEGRWLIAALLLGLGFVGYGLSGLIRQPIKNHYPRRTEVEIIYVGTSNG